RNVTGVQTCALPIYQPASTRPRCRLAGAPSGWALVFSGRAGRVMLSVGVGSPPLGQGLPTLPLLLRWGRVSRPCPCFEKLISSRSEERRVGREGRWR